MSAREVWVVYDGDCPFCTAYTKLVRLRETVGKVHLLDGRADHPVVREVKEKGFDLDEGMVLKMDGAFYHGDQCIHMLALMSSGSSVFNRLNRLLFTNAKFARIAYPWLRAGRNLTLRLLGRRKIKPA